MQVLSVTAFNIEEIRIKGTHNPVSRASSHKKQFQRNRSFGGGRERDFTLEWSRLVSLFGAQRARDKTVQSIIRARIIART